MTTNHSSGGVSSSSGRSQGNRQRAPEKGTAPPPLGRGRSIVSTAKLGSALDGRPCRDPLRVGHAVGLAVAAVRERGLPELDGVEVRRPGLVGVVLGAGA